MYLLALLFISRPALAESSLAPIPEDPEDAESLISDEDSVIVISASRSELLEFESFRSISVLGPEQMAEIQARSSAELVGQMSSVFLQQTNRGSGAPFIRGLVGPQNLILVDGIRFNTSTFRTGPNQYLALLGPVALRQVELVRGPSSILFGNGAMGGVIHALTRDPEVSGGRWAGTLETRVGLASADMSSGGSFQVSSSGDGLALSAGIETVSFGRLRTGGGFELPLSDYGAVYWNSKIIYAPGPDWSVKAAYFGGSLLETPRLDQIGIGDLRFYDNTDHLAYASYSWRGKSWLKSLQLNLSYHRMVEGVRRFSCARDESGSVDSLGDCLARSPAAILRRRFYDDVVQVLGSDLGLLFGFLDDRMIVHSGVEVYQDWVQSALRSIDGTGLVDRGLRGNFSDGSQYVSLGAHLHLESLLYDFGPGVGQLRLYGGGRYSFFRAQADEVPDLGDVRFSYHGLVGSAGVQFLKPDEFNIYFTFMQGFRAPNLQESTVLGDTGDRFEIPNPKLRPEANDTFELGFRYKFDYLRLEASYFYSLWSDIITQEITTYQGRSIIDGKTVHHLVNGRRGVIQGVETEMVANYWRFNLFAAATWTQGDVETDKGNSPARRIPPLFGQLGLRYEVPDETWFAVLYLRWAARQDRLHPSDERDLRICGQSWDGAQLQDPCSGTPGWVTLNARAGWRPDRRFRLDLVLANLMDTRYRMHGSGYDEPGFDIRLSATSSF